MRGNHINIWYQLGRITKISNLEAVVVFMLNIMLILCVFSSNGVTSETVFFLMSMCILIVIIRMYLILDKILCTLFNVIHETK